MRTENSSLDQRGQRKTIERVGKVFPHVRVTVHAKTLVVESVHLCDLSALVISSRQGNTIRISYFHAHQQRHRLQGVHTSVHVISHEEVVRERRFTAYVEEFDHVVELSVYLQFQCECVSEKE